MTLFCAGGHAKRYAGDGWGWRCALLRVKYGHVMWHHNLLERFGGTLSISSSEEIEKLVNDCDSFQIHMQWYMSMNTSSKNQYRHNKSPYLKGNSSSKASILGSSQPQVFQDVSCWPLHMFSRVLNAKKKVPWNSSCVGSTTCRHVSQQGHGIPCFTYLFGSARFFWCRSWPIDVE